MKRQASTLRAVFLGAGFLCATAALPALAQDMRPQPGDVQAEDPSFSPYAGRNFPTQVYWGDTHLHTAVSVDAGTMNTVGQEDAFRFARGEEITTTHGLRARLSRPLDFIVVSDHAEMMGVFPLMTDPEHPLSEQGACRPDAQRPHGEVGATAGQQEKPGGDPPENRVAPREQTPGVQIRLGLGLWVGGGFGRRLWGDQMIPAALAARAPLGVT